MSMKLEQKLTMRSLGWTRGKIEDAVGKVPADGGRILLGRVAGIAVGTKLARDMNDDTITGLKGNFRGQSALDGSMVSSGVCYLPSGIQSMVEGELGDARTNDPNATVRFVLDIYAIPAKNAAGYSYNADNILASDIADPIVDLLAEAQTATPLALVDNSTETVTAEKKGK